MTPDGGVKPALRLQQPPEGGRPAKMLEWLETRGVNAETAEILELYACKYGFGLEKIPKTAICFPHRLKARLVGNRYLGPKGEDAEECVIRVPFNMDGLADNDMAILCASPLEAAVCVSAGYPSATTSPTADVPGGRALDPAEALNFGSDPVDLVYTMLAKIKRFVFAWRMDELGDFFVQQWTDRLGVQRCFRAMFPPGMGPIELVQSNGPDSLRAAIEGAVPAPIRGLVDIKPGDLVAYRNSPALTSYGTGIKDVDRLVRFRPKQLVVVTGNPSGGKTEWVNWAAVRLSMEYGWRWAICSPEHETPQHAGSLAEKYMAAPFRDYGFATKGMPDDTLGRAEDWVRRHFSWIVSDAEEPTTLDFILNTARAAWLRSGIHGLIIDPWNQIQHQRRKDQTLDEYCFEVLRRLLMFAREHDIVLFLMAHSTKLARDRDGKKPIPTLGDINGSQAFWSMAHVGITVHRRNLDIPETDIYVNKIKLKDQGREGSVRMTWKRQTGLYVCDEQPDDEPQQEDMGI